MADRLPFPFLLPDQTPPEVWDLKRPETGYGGDESSPEEGSGGSSVPANAWTDGGGTAYWTDGGSAYWTDGP